MVDGMLDVRHVLPTDTEEALADEGGVTGDGCT